MPRSRRCSASRAPSRPMSPTPAASSIDGRVLVEVRQAARRRMARGVVGAEGGAARSCRSRSPTSAIVYDDDDIVVVDKPSGVAAHPSVGWEGPTVLGALAAGGFRIATTGAAERQGVVHRLDVGTSGSHGRRQDRARLHGAQARVQGARGREDLPRRRAGASRSRWPAPSTRPSGGIPPTRGSSPSRPTARTRSRTTRRSRRSPARRCSRSISRPGARTRSASTWPRTGIRASATRSTAATPPSSARLGLTRQWLHAHELSFAHPSTGDRVTFTSPYPADLAHALEVLRGD